MTNQKNLKIKIFSQFKQKMFVNYDDSSDEDPQPQKVKPKEVKAQTQPKPVQSTPAEQPKKKVMLPSVLGLLNKIPDTHLAVNKVEEKPEKPKLEFESYNNCPPPRY